jgi:hypothetical protein
LRGKYRLPVEQLCDVMLERFAGSAEDDIVLLVLRVV